MSTTVSGRAWIRSKRNKSWTIWTARALLRGSCGSHRRTDIRATAAGVRLQRSQKVDFPFVSVSLSALRERRGGGEQSCERSPYGILRELAETTFGRCNGSKNRSAKSHGCRKPWG